MKRRIVSIALQVLVIVLSSCTSTKVVSDISGNYDFDKVKTYSIVHNEGNDKDVQEMNDFNKTRIEKALVKQLNTTGLVLSENNPDVIINYYTKVELEHDIYANGSISGMGYGRRGYGGMSASGSKTASLETTTNGFVIVEMIDGDDDIVWFASGEQTINKAMVSEEADKSINAAIEKMMEQFPIKNNR